ncbi:MAG: hypothetical protein AB1461_15715 [Thermodesulfobacteriota bacterium]
MTACGLPVPCPVARRRHGVIIMAILHLPATGIFNLSENNPRLLHSPSQPQRFTCK